MTPLDRLGPSLTGRIRISTVICYAACAMSLQASPMVPIPAETARVAHAAFPKGTLCLQLRDTLGPLYADAQCAALFAPTGQPAEAPARLALVLILQFAENLSDRQAADAVRGRIDWQYALGL